MTGIKAYSLVIAIALHGPLYFVDFSFGPDEKKANYGAQLTALPEKTQRELPETRRTDIPLTEGAECEINLPEVDCSLPEFVMPDLPEPKVDLSKLFEIKETPLQKAPDMALCNAPIIIRPAAEEAREVQAEPIPPQETANKDIVPAAPLAKTPEPPKESSSPGPQPESMAKKTEPTEGEDVGRRAELVYCEKPVYPRLAQRRGFEGVVKIKIRILRDGSVGEVEIAQSSCHESLDEAALDAARKCRFKPVVIDGEQVVVEQVLPFEFKLTGK